MDKAVLFILITAIKECIFTNVVVESDTEYLFKQEEMDQQTSYSVETLNSAHNSKIGNQFKKNISKNLIETFEIRYVGNKTITIPLNIPAADVMVHKYTRQQQKFTKNQSNESRLFIDLFCKIEEDYSFTFSFLLNMMFKSRLNGLDDYTLKKNHIRVYKKFNNILNKYSKDINFDINTQDLDEKEIIYLYNKFIKFVNWTSRLYKFEEIKKLKDNKFQYDSIMQIVNKSNKEHQKTLIHHIIGILCSKNFCVLLKILPEFRFIFKLRENGLKQGEILILFKLFQIILCKFESFRYKYLKENGLEAENLENLYLNSEFNETIATIGLLLKEILLILGFNNLEILDSLNFIYFIRAKCSNYYCKLEELQKIIIINEYTQKYTLNEDLYLVTGVDMFFTRTYTNTIFYKIHQKISKYRSNSLEKNYFIAYDLRSRKCQ